MNAQSLTEALGGRWNGSKGIARCPAHNDTHPSMSITTGTKHDVILHCFVCDQQDVIAKLREMGLWEDTPMVAPPVFHAPKQNGHASEWDDWVIQAPTTNGHASTVTYPYYDEHGTLLFQKTRKPNKQFSLQKPDGSARIDGIRRVLYHLPQLINSPVSEHVFIVEGEKDVDRLTSLGLLAVTNFDGADGAWLPEYSEPFAGRHVIIIPDNDDIGRKHAETVRTALLPIAGSIRVLELPGLPHKGDVSDWLDAGGTMAELEQLIAALDVQPPQRFTLLTGDDIENMPPLQWLADGWLSQGGLSTLYGPSGGGKSFATLDLCLSVANGTEWLESIPVHQGPVVYVLAEGIGGLKQRQRAWLARHPGCTTENIRYVATAVSLLDPTQVHEIIAAIRAQFKEPVLIALDTLARAIVGGDENSAKDMGIAVQSADTIRAAFKCHVLLVHHTGRNGDHERGSSALYGGLDHSLYLSADDGSIQLQSRKQKDAVEPEPIGLKLVEVEGTESCILEVFDATGDLTKVAANLLICLGSNFPIEEGASTSQWKSTSGLTDRSYYRARTVLITSGFVIKKNGRFGQNVLTEPGIEEFKRMQDDRFF